MSLLIDLHRSRQTSARAPLSAWFLCFLLIGALAMIGLSIWTGVEAPPG